jgi:hypothetical protein
VDGEETTAAGVRRVFDHWRAQLDHPKARLDGKREALIRRRLGEYAVDDLVRAIDGYASSAWHRGENERGVAYDQLDLILRDAAHIERGWQLSDKQAPAAAPDPWEEGLAKLAARKAERNENHGA